jgi:predicted RNA-binding Zn-ribbon protein involved in translation (DUF1610 family)
MPAKKKINLEIVRASLDTICTKCGHRIGPAEIQRVDFTAVKCPKCGQLFCPAKPGA